MEFVTIVVMVALLEYVFFSMQVGFARQKFGVQPPAVSGNTDWERINRVHVNTLEQLIIFIPAIYGFSQFTSAKWAAIIGVAFIVGRMVYFIGYKKAAEKRAIGFAIGWFANMALVIGTIVGCIMKLT